MLKIPTKLQLEKRSHLSLKEIASEFNVSTTTVYLWFKHHNINKLKCYTKFKKPPKEVLEPLAHTPLKDIAKQYKTSLSTVYSWFTEYEIHKKTKPSKEQLESLLHLTRSQIAKQFNVTKQCVSLWCKEYNLEFKKPIRYNFIPIPPIEELNDNLTLMQKAEKFKVCHTTIINWLKHYNIYSNKNKPPKEQLESLKHLPQIEIANTLNLSHQYISYLFKHYNIVK